MKAYATLFLTSALLTSTPLAFAEEASLPAPAEEASPASEIPSKATSPDSSEEKSVPAEALVKPSAVPVDTTATKVRSKPLLYGGIALSVVGTAGLVTGLWSFTQSHSTSCASTQGSRPAGASGEWEVGYDGCTLATIGDGVRDGMSRTLGIGLMAAGGTAIVGGTIMAIVGGWKVPASPKKDARPSKIPRVDVGLGSATLGWTF